MTFILFCGSLGLDLGAMGNIGVGGNVALVILWWWQSDDDDGITNITYWTSIFQTFH